MSNSALCSGKLVPSKRNRFLFYFVPFLFGIGYYLYQLLINHSFSSAEGYYLFHYLYNYSRGFMVRGFVGEVLSLLFPIITPGITKGTMMVLSLLLVSVSAYGIGRALEKSYCNRDHFYVVLFLLLLICFMPSSFRNMMADAKMDRLYWVFMLLAVYLADTKVGLWFCPILCLMATAVNMVFLFTAMLPIAIVLLQLFYDHHYAKKNLLICIVSYGSMIALVLWGMGAQQRLGFADAGEFIDYYLSRYSEYAGVRDQFVNPDEYVHWFGDYFVPFEDFLPYSFRMYFEQWGNGCRDVVAFVLIAVPSYCILTKFWRCAMRNADNKMQKFIFFLCMISWVLIIPPVLISWELYKYVSLNIISNLCLIIWYLARRNADVSEAVNKALAFANQNAVRAGIVLAFCGLMLAI